jgi:23S rRNA (guanosine2251-2'-O)-methyltransferase
MTPPTDRFPSMIPGFHGIREALIHERFRIRELWFAEGKNSQRTKELVEMAKEKGIPVRFVRTVELERRFPGLRHQGMVAVSEPFSYSSLAEIVQRAEKEQEWGLIVAADHITDEGNLGALIRAGAFFGAAGLIIPKDRSAQVSPKVIKRSSGAAGLLAVCRVVNLRRALDSLNEQGFWIIGTAGGNTQPVYEFDWKRNLVLVLGNEERGLSSSVRNGCHAVVAIPRFGSMESLNVSVAAGVILGEIRRQQKQ